MHPSLRGEGDPIVHEPRLHRGGSGWLDGGDSRAGLFDLAVGIGAKASECCYEGEREEDLGRLHNLTFLFAGGWQRLLRMESC